ncbi:hypothetical protein IWX90DRAFT_46938 [Phyllosticta citrichinensis]|uniref:Uncharacterized protein n=1 Tax=Phyllosticta citrichinensis TaxID=1130410 RepID=A0ABR1XI75_9PEZI
MPGSTTSKLSISKPMERTRFMTSISYFTSSTCLLATTGSECSMFLICLPIYVTDLPKFHVLYHLLTDLLASYRILLLCCFACFACLLACLHVQFFCRIATLLKHQSKAIQRKRLAARALLAAVPTRKKQISQGLDICKATVAEPHHRHHHGVLVAE